LCGKVKPSSLGFPGINLLLERYGWHNYLRKMDWLGSPLRPTAVEPFAPGRDGAGTPTGRNRANNSAQIYAPGEPYALLAPTQFRK
jgi:hypothetical protein